MKTLPAIRRVALLPEAKDDPRAGGAGITNDYNVGGRQESDEAPREKLEELSPGELQRISPAHVVSSRHPQVIQHAEQADLVPEVNEHLVNLRGAAQGLPCRVSATCWTKIRETTTRLLVNLALY